MKPKSPFTQTFGQLPGELPIHVANSALLPGGELPLELSRPADLALSLDALKNDQLIGIVQARPDSAEDGTYGIGCAGRIRQYRERSDGRLNLMLSGICRFRIVDELATPAGFRKAKVDWQGFADDFETEDVEASRIEAFRRQLRRYFDTHGMQVDWKVLDERHIEEVVNNLVLVINLDVDDRQRLLETPTVTRRLQVFGEILDRKTVPVVTAAPVDGLVN